MTCQFQCLVRISYVVTLLKKDFICCVIVLYHVADRPVIYSGNASWILFATPDTDYNADNPAAKFYLF